MIVCFANWLGKSDEGITGYNFWRDIVAESNESLIWIFVPFSYSLKNTYIFFNFSCIITKLVAKIILLPSRGNLKIEVKEHVA